MNIKLKAALYATGGVLTLATMGALFIGYISLLEFLGKTTGYPNGAFVIGMVVPMVSILFASMYSSSLKQLKKAKRKK